MGETTTADLIVSNPEILAGKPCVRGTRLSVEFLLELAASGATPAEMLAAYPPTQRRGVVGGILVRRSGSQARANHRPLTPGMNLFAFALPVDGDAPG